MAGTVGDCLTVTRSTCGAASGGCPSQRPSAMPAPKITTSQYFLTIAASPIEEDSDYLHRRGGLCQPPDHRRQRLAVRGALAACQLVDILLLVRAGAALEDDA